MSTTHTTSLLAEIDAFLASSGMGESYFGKVAVGNSELVKRLRANRRVFPDTADRVRGFIRARQNAGALLDAHDALRNATRQARSGAK